MPESPEFYGKKYAAITASGAAWTNTQIIAAVADKTPVITGLWFWCDSANEYFAFLAGSGGSSLVANWKWMISQYQTDGWNGLEIRGTKGLSVVVTSDSILAGNLLVEYHYE